MYKNDFVTSIILTNVRNTLNDSFESRTELVQNAYNTSIVRNAQKPEITEKKLLYIIKTPNIKVILKMIFKIT